MCPLGLGQLSTWLDLFISALCDLGKHEQCLFMCVPICEVGWCLCILWLKGGIKSKRLEQSLGDKLSFWCCLAGILKAPPAPLLVFSLEPHPLHLPIKWPCDSSALAAHGSDLLWCCGMLACMNTFYNYRSLVYPLKTILLGLWYVCSILWSCLRFMITNNLLYSLDKVGWCFLSNCLWLSGDQSSLHWRWEEKYSCLAANSLQEEQSCFLSALVGIWC